MPPISKWNNLAQEYQDKFMDLDLYNRSYDEFCATLPKSQSEILDLACGPGNISAYIKRQHTDCIIHGIDSADQMIKLAQQNVPDGKFTTLDCRNLEQVRGKYAGVICGFVLPYLSQDETFKLVSDCRNILRRNGTLYLSAIEGIYAESGYQYASNGEGKMFVYKHEEKWLKSCLEKLGFELISVDRIAYPKMQPTSTHLILLARMR